MRAAFNGKYSSFITNRLICNIPLKKILMNAMISNMVYSFEKHRKPPKNSRPKLAVFQIFQDTFFYGLLFSIQEGPVKVLTLVPSLFVAEIDLFGLSYRCGQLWQVSWVGQKIAVAISKTFYVVLSPMLPPITNFIQIG